MGLTFAPNPLGPQPPNQSVSVVPGTGVDLASGAQQGEMLTALQQALLLLAEISEKLSSDTVPANAFIDDLGSGEPFVDDLGLGEIFIDDLAA